MFIQRTKSKIMENQIKWRLLLFTFVSFFLYFMFIEKPVYAWEDTTIYYAPSINYENLQAEIRITNLEYKGVHITLDTYDKNGNQTQQLTFSLKRNETERFDVNTFPNGSESVAILSSGKIAAYLVVVSEDKEKVIPFLEYKSNEPESQQLEYSKEIKKTRALELKWDNRPIFLLAEEDFEPGETEDLTEGLENHVTEIFELTSVSLPETTATGFYFPIGKSEFRSACGQWLARDSANGGCYESGLYHTGIDMMTTSESDHPVYAISDGAVKYRSDDASSWGSGNCALAILHRLYDNREFLAIYGHIRTNLQPGVTVTGGRQIGTVGPLPPSIGDHLHFGIRLSLTHPYDGPGIGWGRMSNSFWPDTNGFVDPMYWITNMIPLPTSDNYEADNSALYAKDLILNGKQSHSIHIAGDTDWAKFTLKRRKTVRIETKGYTGDTEMWLYGPNSSTTLIEYDDDDGYGLFSMIERTLDPGTYYVKIQEYGNNGTIPGYKLLLHEISPVWTDKYEPDDSASNAKLIGNGNTGQVFEQIRSIHAAGNADWAKFTLRQRSKVRIETNGVYGDTEMWLYGPNSSTTRIEYDDDDGYGLFSMIERTLDPGTYYVKITEYLNDGTIPVYTLSTSISSPSFPVIGRDRFEDDNIATSAKVVSVDKGAQTHSIHIAGDTDWIKFTLTQRKTVRIETNGYSGDTEMWLYGPNSSTALIEYDDDDGYGYFSMIERTLGPGTYYIKIQEYYNNGTIDFYILSVDALP